MPQSELDRLFGAAASGKPPESASELDRLFGSSPAQQSTVPTPPAPVEAPYVAYKGPLQSLIPEARQAKVVSALLGHDVPARPEPEAQGVRELLSAAKADPKTAAVETAKTLSGIPAVMSLLQTVKETAPDIGRGLVSHPIETLRGGAAGVAEGAMQAASPLNLLLLSLAKLRGGKRPSGPPGASPDAPLYKQQAAMEAVPEPKVPLTGGRVQMPPVQSPRPAVPPGRVVGKTPVLTDVLDDALKAARETPPITTGKRPGMTDPRYAQIEQIGESAGKVATAKGPEAAAAHIEQRVKLTVNELARAMRDTWGSERAGKYLQPNMPAKVGRAQILRLAPGESKMPTIVKESIRDTSGLMTKGSPAQQAGYATTLRKYAPEGGEISPTALLAGGGATAGALIGGAGDAEWDERLAHAGLGAVAGAVTVPLIARALSGYRGEGAMKGAEKAFQDATYTSVLSSPQSVAKAYLGGIGGAIAMGLEKLAAGEPGGAVILRELFNQKFVGGVAKALRHPASASMQSGFAEKAPTIIGRVFSAVNEPAMRAMLKGGAPYEEAVRATLAGTPTTPIASNVLSLWNQYFSLRLMTSLFPRVGVQLLERGAERSPLGLLNLPGLNPGASSRMVKTRAAMGTGAAIGAYAGSDELPDWAKPFAVALAGPYGIPAAVGFGAGKVADRGKGLPEQATAALDEIGQALPFSRYGSTEGLKQVASGASLVPNVLRDVARGMDPYERKNEGFFGRTKAKIPGLRETLPVRPRPVNLAGELNEDRSSAVTRMLTAPTMTGDPYKNIPAPLVAELKRLDVSIESPAGRSKEKVGKRDVSVPPEAIPLIQRQRRQFLVPRLEKLLTSRAYQKAPDEQKKRLLATTIRQANATGAQQARQTLLKLLKAEPKP
ncbi:MAG: hypothetical protein NUW01_19855 [Gemmatimonadaceae bacterium]|nr:hypothetical protein [Gemmatimonadaceae bacterium]